MSEKYPETWRATCLLILKGMKEEKRRSLGYKRMSWDVIRNQVMKDFDEYRNGELFRIDKRLIRQSLESWERGSELLDEKFDLIDRYIRKLLEDDDNQIVFDAIKRAQFERSASTLSMIYGQRRGSELLPQFMSANFPWGFYAEGIIGTWYKSIALIGLEEHSGVIRVIVAYLPSSIDDFKKEEAVDVVLMEGFLIPLESIDRFYGRFYWSSNSTEFSLRKRIVCALKLNRPEYQGLSGIGYADGEIHVPIPFVNQSHKSDLILEYPSPAVCPMVSSSWITNKIGEKVVVSEEKLSESISDQNVKINVFTEFLHELSINLKYVDNFADSYLYKMIVSIYVGYVY